MTNYPRGGKRAMFANPTFLLDKIAREFGPHICCGPTMGCLLGTPEAHHCQKESLYSQPYVAGFAMCRGNSGRCAANGIMNNIPKNHVSLIHHAN
ncbi:PREDICTED: isotocin-neurophysin IT 2-like [Ceratosolen solmsi marchali]|uniref:Isotocin-neurophysin IT 2-like n=1 Tax=Ceratosolen solmsi marchali TaxID=326594 RepID=A0AAJ6YWR5_9HYME|nr:PREDICTED: isotocin-neurophysin IT 2-like [Ceratosolen solmsi marchali]